MTMNRHVYNASMLVGLVLASGGAAMVSVPLGLMVAGGIVIGVTVVTAVLGGGSR
ncbi:MAG: hypothetical protein RJA36_2686 [Pseudomonadota bacterium]